MAWNTASMTKTAGDLILFLDTYLVANAHWSIYDANAGTNCKVYRNYFADQHSDFYVKVDDNYTDYAIIELWEGWDNVNHVGTGQSLTTINGSYQMKIFKEASTFGIAVSDLRFIIVDFKNSAADYIGQLSRFDTTKNMPVYIGRLGIASYNASGYYSTSSSAGWACLFDEAGVSNTLTPLTRSASSMYIKANNGVFWVCEWPVFNYATYNLLGVMEGMAWIYSTNNGLNKNDTILVNGVEWVACGGNNYWSLVKKA